MRKRERKTSKASNTSMAARWLFRKSAITSAFSKALFRFDTFSEKCYNKCWATIGSRCDNAGCPLCSVKQCVAVCQYCHDDSTASHYTRKLQRTASHCNTLQHTATANEHKTTPFVLGASHSATHCNTLQHTATHYNTLQQRKKHKTTPFVLEASHSATHCNTLQHTATRVHYKSLRSSKHHRRAIHT